MNIFNVPNMLSISRILAVPVFLVLMLEPSPVRALIAGIVFGLASATDWLDGYLARKWGQVTKIGKLLDPVADKILIMSALIVLVEINIIPAWIAAVLIGREFVVTGLRSIASAEGVIIPAENMGKLKVGAQITAVLSLLFNYYLERDWLSTLGWLALWIALILAVVSAMHYFRIYGKRLRIPS